jgi:hypothetical protein
MNNSERTITVSDINIDTNDVKLNNLEIVDRSFVNKKSTPILSKFKKSFKTSSFFKKNDSSPNKIAVTNKMSSSSTASSSMNASMSSALKTTQSAAVKTVNLAAETADAAVNLARQGVGVSKDLASKTLNTTQVVTTHVLAGLEKTASSAANEGSKMVVTALETASHVTDATGKIIGTVADTTGKVVDSTGEVIGSIADTTGTVVDNTGKIIGTASDFAAVITQQAAKAGESVSQDVLNTSTEITHQTGIVTQEVAKQMGSVTVDGLKLVGTSLMTSTKLLQGLVNRVSSKLDEQQKTANIKKNVRGKVINARINQKLAEEIIRDFNKTATTFIENVDSLYTLRLSYALVIEKAFKERYCISAMFGRRKCGIEESSVFSKYKKQIDWIRSTAYKSSINKIQYIIKTVGINIQSASYKPSVDIIEYSNNEIQTALDSIASEIENINTSFDNTYNILSLYTPASITNVSRNNINKTKQNGGKKKQLHSSLSSKTKKRRVSTRK